ncbi:PilZ domain-containing protein [Phycisphaera mikurensis]|uniref:Uncharacterized protein n=1 Tax=Phycisphaera mikurensis (strain NBRC 102666 / KCTC 22515 / FYK2301M01) TaxID=1142394 RepID=I0IHC1_PHYMF|nr:PilZ domain-containing protein [Phycisphaera mikurensis]MBB6440908.1 hypothetical protein [Phycisphaera mikurensis]BAM04659.1 hypothetical protein PSMK_25000 [Phycisphaera mikurensis NBRC 102666]
MRLQESDWTEALQRISHEQALLGERTAADRGGVPRDVPRSDRQRPCMLRVADGAGGHAVHEVMTRNSGRGGVSVLHNEALNTGEPVTLAMQLDDGRGFVAPANVAWCRRIGQVGEGAEVCFEIGFRFAAPLAAAA